VLTTKYLGSPSLTKYKSSSSKSYSKSKSSSSYKSKSSSYSYGYDTGAYTYYGGYGYAARRRSYYDYNDEPETYYNEGSGEEGTYDGSYDSADTSTYTYTPSAYTGDYNYYYTYDYDYDYDYDEEEEDNTAWVVVGVVLGLAALVFIVVCCVQKHSKNKRY
jgi:hypothetical protein